MYIQVPTFRMTHFKKVTESPKPIQATTHRLVNNFNSETIATIVMFYWPWNTFSHHFAFISHLCGGLECAQVDCEWCTEKLLGRDGVYCLWHKHSHSAVPPPTNGIKSLCLFLARSWSVCSKTEFLCSPLGGRTQWALASQSVCTCWSLLLFWPVLSCSVDISGDRYLSVLAGFGWWEWTTITFCV